MKYLLLVVITFLLVWMFCLLERESGLTYYLNDRQAMLFVALSILTGSSLIAFCVQSSSNDSEISLAYCKIKAELENGPLTREELGAKVGSRHDNSGFASQGHIETSLSQQQHVLLDRLFYEGKILERNGKLCLPS